MPGATGASRAITWTRCGACCRVPSPPTTSWAPERRTRCASCVSWRSRTRAGGERVGWLPLGLVDAAPVRKVVALPYDAVVHLAAVSSGTDATRDPGFAWTVNAAGTARVVDVLAEAKRTGRADPVVLVVSTGEVYGVSHEPRPRRETDPVAPCSSYAASTAGAAVAGPVAWRATGPRVI